jgi:hypothetical protein
MSATLTSFGPWQHAYKLVAGSLEMIIVTEIGPRILSLRIDDQPNILYVAEDAPARDQWNIYGGHRIWLGPESEAAVAPDNAACQVTLLNDGIMVETPIDPLSKLQKALIVTPTDNAFRVRNIIRNTGTMLATGTVWALTCVRPDAKVFFPWGRPGNWRMKKICYWTSWCGGKQTSNVQSPQWQPTEELFVIDPTGEVGKVGTNGHEGWIGAIFPTADTTFYKRFSYQEGATYADEGCAIQCYTCKHMIELETLSPFGVIPPGEEVIHEECWKVRRGLADLTQPDAIRAELGVSHCSDGQ